MRETFTGKLIHWHSMENKRIMPWKGEKDPYKVWLSEIILQQTRVLQGMSYYNKFIKEFPTIEALARAPEEVVYKAWEGLGYYSRCKNLILTAKYIAEELDGIFPETYESILALKGVGPYTAAAISSFAYGLPHAVVDGNVLRVLARFFGEALPVDSPKGKDHFTNLANRLLYTKDSAAYNQAIMDFGATICKPQVPGCRECVLQDNCFAFKNSLVNKLPVKEKRLLKKNRFFTYFIFSINNKYLVNKRPPKDIWEGLYEFYLFETDKDWGDKPKEIKKWLLEQLDIKEFVINSISDSYKQQLTHQNIKGRFIAITLSTVPESLKGLKTVNKGEITSMAFPKLINQYLKDKNLFSEEHK